MRESLTNFRLTGLRARLLGIVLLAVVPLALLLFSYAAFESGVAQDRVRADIRRQLADDVGSLQGIVAQSRATLTTFGITYAIQAHRWDLAQGNSERLAAEHPEYAAIVVADSAGIVRASWPRTTHPLDVSRDPAFSQAVASRNLVVSGYRTDPLIGKTTVAVSLPVYDARNRLTAVEYIALAPEQLAARMAPADPSAVEVLFDSQGTVVARKPSLEGVVGHRLPQGPLVHAVLTAGSGTASVAGLDGVVRQYYFAPVTAQWGDALHLATGFAPDQLLASQRRTFWLTFAGFGLVTLLALSAAALVGTRSIYRPARQLSVAAGSLAQGDLSARAAMANRSDEFGALGKDFNAMADAIESQVGELERARKELDTLNAELEDRVRRRTAELEASNDELAAFSYSVSHDLRSPLRAIDGFSLALVEDYADALGEQGRDDLRRVREAANRMGELIDSLLKLSRLSRQEMRLEKVELSAMAEEVADSLRQEGPDRDVIFRIEPDVTGLADASLVRIVLDNLIGNAWKFTSKRALAHIEFGQRRTDGETVYYVRDDGAGFEMAYVHKLFGAFQRIHGQTEFPGIGIGLATTARIIHRHGGRIWAQGEPGKGATFFFTLS